MGCGISNDEAYKVVKLLVNSVVKVSELIYENKDGDEAETSCNDEKGTVAGSGVAPVNENKLNIASFANGMNELLILLAKGKLKKKEKAAVLELLTDENIKRMQNKGLASDGLEKPVLIRQTNHIIDS